MRCHKAPLRQGFPPPSVLTLSRERDDSGLRPIRDVTREELLAKDIIVSNFHALGTGEDEGDVLHKLQPDDVDLLIIDEAHIAAV